MKRLPGPSLPTDVRSRREVWRLSWAAERSDLTSPPGRLASGTGSMTSDPDPGLARQRTTRPRGAASAWEAGSRGHVGARPSGELTSVLRPEVGTETGDLQRAEYRPLSS